MIWNKKTKKDLKLRYTLSGKNYFPHLISLLQEPYVILIFLDYKKVLFSQHCENILCDHLEMRQS